MRFRAHIRNFSLVLWPGLLLLSACATTIPSEALMGVDHSISFQNLRENPEAFTGKTVVLGGEVISTENQPGKTHLIILQHDLDGDMKPLDNDQSKGRFIVTVPEFMDPAIYAKGRRITAVGTVAGKETRQLNDIPYVYPVIMESYLYLWPAEQILDSQPRVYFGIGIGIGSSGF
ncbi:MAG: Slp family lipoprotein [Deltaproteobacteria bacterium]|nr:Slp family lipoprotein [Deltaproteobacteria bacterium]